MLPIRPYYANMSTYRSTFHIVHKITMGYLSVFITVNLCVRFCILTFDIQVSVVVPSFDVVLLENVSLSLDYVMGLIHVPMEVTSQTQSVVLTAITFNVPVVSVSLPIDDVMGLQDAQLSMHHLFSPLQWSLRLH